MRIKNPEMDHSLPIHATVTLFEKYSTLQGLNSLILR